MNSSYYTDTLISLTDREKEIFRYLANGFTAKEIAQALYISTHTVHTHRKNLITKMDARNTVHMVVKILKSIST